MMIPTLKRCIFILIGFVVTTTCWSQEQDTTFFTWSEFRKLVLERNLRVEMASNNTQAAIKSIDASKTYRLPEINFRFVDLFNAQKISEEGVPLANTNIYNAGIRLSQNIYSGGIVKQNIERAEIIARKALAGEDVAATDVVYFAGINYYQAVAIKREKEIWSNYRDRFATFLESVRNKVSAGVVNRTDQLLVEVQLIRIDQQILTVNRKYENAMLDLRRVAYLNRTAPIGILDTIDLTYAIADTNGIYEKAFNSRPEWKVLEEDLAAVSLEERVIKGSYLPNIGISVSGVYTNGIVNNGANRFNANIIGGISVPITRWGRKNRQVEANQYQQLITEGEYNIERQNIIFEIESAYFNLQEVRKQLDLSFKAVDLSYENVKHFINRYDAGLSSIVEVTEAQTLLNEALLLLLQQRVVFQLTVLDFQRATGVLVTY